MNSALEQLIEKLNLPDRGKRFAAIREISHVFQRPDLATCDVLIEIGHQLALFREAYELVNSVADRRSQIAQVEREAYQRGLQEGISKAPPPPPPPPPQTIIERRQPLNALLRTKQWHDNPLKLSPRAYSLLTENGEQARTKEELLAFQPRGMPGFGKRYFAELVVGLMRYARIPRSSIEISNLWLGASKAMQECAEEYIAQWKNSDSSPEKPANVTEIQA